MIYLYVKRLPTGLFYLGKTEQDPNVYLGSGNDWLKEIKQNNFTIKDIETWILHKTESKEEIVKLGRYYSNLFNVVESENWANLKEEEGDGGATNKGRIVINNGETHKFVYSSQLDHYTNTGWELGYNKDSIEKTKKTKLENDSNKIGAIKMAITRKNNGSFITGAKKGIDSKKTNNVFEKSILKMIETKNKNNTAHLGAIKAAKTKKEKGIPNGMQGRKHTKEAIEKLKGPKSEEHKNKLKKSKRKSKCLYCQTYVDGGNMKRWHGKDRCTVKK